MSDHSILWGVWIDSDDQAGIIGQLLISPLPTCQGLPASLLLQLPTSSFFSSHVGTQGGSSPDGKTESLILSHNDAEGRKKERVERLCCAVLEQPASLMHAVAPPFFPLLLLSSFIMDGQCKQSRGTESEAQ